MNQLQTDVLVVGGGTGGTAAALQAARRGGLGVNTPESRPPEAKPPINPGN